MKNLMGILIFFVLSFPAAFGEEIWNLALVPQFCRDDIYLKFVIAVYPQTSLRAKNAVHFLDIKTDLSKENAFGIASAIGNPDRSIRKHRTRRNIPELVKIIDSLSPERIAKDAKEISDLVNKRWLKRKELLKKGFWIEQKKIKDQNKQVIGIKKTIKNLDLIFPKDLGNLVDEELKTAILKNHPPIQLLSNNDYFPTEPSITPAIKSKVNGQGTIVFVGDPGAYNPAQLSVMKAIKKACKQYQCDFGIWMGDSFYDHGVQSVYDSAFHWQYHIPLQGIDFPIYHLVGNHDMGNPMEHGHAITEGNEHKQDAIEKDEKILVDRARLIPNEQFKMPALYYTVNLDFGEGIASFHNLHTMRYTRETQGKWLEKSFELVRNTYQNRKIWQTVVGHHAIYSVGKHASSFFQRELAPVLNGNADIYISGHEHLNAVIEDKANQIIYTIAGNACQKTKSKHIDVGRLPNSLSMPFMLNEIGFTIIRYKQDKTQHYSFQVNVKNGNFSLKNEYTTYQ